MNIVVATKNKNKVFEIARMFEPLGFNVMSQEDAGIDVDVEETGNTFAKNALIKARAVAMLCDDCVLADDSGLCVEALDGRPGVMSARYAGPGATDIERIEKLLMEMQDKTNRKAKFVTNIAFIFPDGREIVTQGEVSGRILREPVGNNGFGYDPIFYSDELEKSFAQAKPDEKNAISHRGRALWALYDEIKDMIDRGNDN